MFRRQRSNPPIKNASLDPVSRAAFNRQFCPRINTQLTCPPLPPPAGPFILKLDELGLDANLFNFFIGHLAPGLNNGFHGPFHGGPFGGPFGGIASVDEKKP